MASASNMKNTTTTTTSTTPWTKTTLRNLVPTLQQQGFSNPAKTAKQVMNKLKELVKKNKTSVVLEIKPRAVWFVDYNTRSVLDIIEETTPKEEMQRCVCHRDEEEKELEDAMRWAQKEKEEIVFYSILGHCYSCYSWAELFQQVDDWHKNKIDDVELTQDNIQPWMRRGKKYYRITFTSTRMTRQSRTEFVFGRIVDGLTYVVKQEDFEKHQAELYQKLNPRRGVMAPFWTSAFKQEQEAVAEELATEPPPAPKPKQNKKKNKKNKKKLKVLKEMKSRIVATDHRIVVTEHRINLD